MGRALLRQPDLLLRWQRGEVEESLCVHCNKCIPTIYKGTHCVLVAPEDRPGHGGAESQYLRDTRRKLNWFLCNCCRGLPTHPLPLDPTPPCAPSPTGSRATPTPNRHPDGSPPGTTGISGCPVGPWRRRLAHFLGAVPSPCQVRGMLKDVAQQRQTTTNVSAGQSGYRGCDQGHRGRRNRPYKAGAGVRVPQRPPSGMAGQPTFRRRALRRGSSSRLAVPSVCPNDRQMH